MGSWITYVSKMTQDRGRSHSGTKPRVQRMEDLSHGVISLNSQEEKGVDIGYDHMGNTSIIPA